MGRIAWIAAGIIVSTMLTIVVNLATSGGAWWLWPVLGLLGVTAVITEVVRERRASPSESTSQEISAAGRALVKDSPQLAEGTDGPVSQKIRARRGSVVRRSGQTARRR